MYKRLFALAFLAIPPSAAHAQPTPEDADRFGAREAVQSIDISPSGQRIVYIGAGRGRTSVAYVVDLSAPNPQPRAVTESRANPHRLRWCRFATEDRLVCQIEAVQSTADGTLFAMGRLFAINIDGSRLRELGQRSSFDDIAMRQFDGSIIDWMPGASGTVLMARLHVPQGTSAGSRIGSEDRGLGVDRVNVVNGQVSRVERPSDTADLFLSDGRGNVRIMGETVRRGETGQIGTRQNLFYRAPNGNQWLPLGSYDYATHEGMLPLAIEAETNSVYVLRRLNGRMALYRVRLEGSLDSSLVYANERVDVDGVVRASRGARIVGVTFAEERRRVIYFDQQYQQLAASLGRAIPNLPQIDFVGASADGQRLLIYAGADRSRPLFHLRSDQPEPGRDNAGPPRA